jgi:hypothetical protein
MDFVKVTSFRMQLWPVEHFLTIFGVALLLHPSKSDDKNGQEMFN